MSEEFEACGSFVRTKRRQNGSHLLENRAQKAKARAMRAYGSQRGELSPGSGDSRLPFSIVSAS